MTYLKKELSIRVLPTNIQEIKLDGNIQTLIYNS